MGIRGGVTIQVPATPKIGDRIQGGVVIYIANPPRDLNGDGRADNGLVCSLVDVSLAIPWLITSSNSSE